jgi:hypothetical protein
VTSSERLLALIARLEPTPGSLARELAGPVDWEDLAELLRQHRLMARAAEMLRPHEHLLPASLRARLRRAQADSWSLNEEVGRMGAQLLAGLGDRSLAVMPLKGPWLADRLGGLRASRPTTDLDLLARRLDLEALDRALRELGFQPWEEQPPLAATVRHRNYASPAEWWIGVEVHVEFAHSDSGGWMDRLWERAVLQPWEGMQLLAPAATDHVLLLCVHAANHGWMHFCHLVDLAEALKQEGSGLDWDALVEEARLAGLKATAFFSLLLARAVCAAAVPAPALKSLRPGWVRRHLLQAWIYRRGLVRPRRALVDGPYSNLLQAVLHDDGGRRLRLLAARAWPPSNELPAGEDGVGRRVLRLARNGMRLADQVAAAATSPGREGLWNRLRAQKKGQGRTF